MSLVNAALGGYGYEQTRQDTEALQDEINQEIARLSQQTTQDVQFQPFTVTSSLGGVQTDEAGGYTTTLTPEQQALQDQMFGGASNFFNQAMQGTAGREQDIYNRIRAAQAPQEEMARLATEERLASQGRLGLSSAMYGGANPELYAQETAISNARNQAMLSAMSQAQQEQLQQANLGQSMFQSGYMPQANLLNMLQPATNLSQLVGTGAREGASLLAQLGLGGLVQNKDLQMKQMDAFQQLLATLGTVDSDTKSSLADQGVDWFLDKLGL